MKYDHECYTCEHQWVSYYSINLEEPPADTLICPKCGDKGRRVILGCPMTRVVMGRLERKKYLAEESRKIQEKVKTDEKLRVNLVGEEKYHQAAVEKAELTQNLKNV